MPPYPRNEIFFPCNNARLRSAQKLVPAEHHDGDPCLDALPNKRLRDSVRGKIDETARAKIFDKRKPCALAKPGQFFKPRFFRKSSDAKIGRMHAQKQTRFLVDRVFVVSEPRAVRGADFPQHRPAFRHNLWNAETVTNLDQLAARYDDLATLCQSGENEQHSRSAVVDHNGCFSPSQPLEQG